MTRELPAVSFRDVTKRFGDFEALRGLDLEVPKGQVFGLLGPNGSGKTTAIRILCGLTKATDGEAEALGARMPDRAVLPRIGYMPQETALYQELTVRENLELFGSLYGMTPADLKARVDDLLGLVDLTDWKEAVVSTLSGGMRHRTSLVASMLHDPDLLVLDEPTVGVDPELRANFWSHFRGLAEAGKTILITTHYMDEARNCHRIALMSRGCVIAEGAPRQVMEEAGVSDLEEAFLHYAGGARA